MEEQKPIVAEQVKRIQREKYTAHKPWNAEKDKRKPTFLAPAVDIIDVDIDSGQSIKATTTSSLRVASWVCGHCTFINNGVAAGSSCVMCGSDDVYSYADNVAAATNVHQRNKGNDNDDDDDDDSVTFVPNPAVINQRSEQTRADNFPCYIMGNELCDTHPMSKENGGWIWAKTHQFVNLSDGRKEDVPGLVKEFDTMVRQRSPKEITRDIVLGLALKHGVTCGKWLIYQKADHAAQVWQKIRDALYSYRLGSVAKIGKQPIEYGSFVVCVYCDDFRDKKDVSASLLYITTRFTLHVACPSYPPALFISTF